MIKSALRTEGLVALLARLRRMLAAKQPSAIRAWYLAVLLAPLWGSVDDGNFRFQYSYDGTLH